MGAAPSSGIALTTDADGYARFHAVRGASSAGQGLTLDCADSAGKNSSYPVDLKSGDTFVTRPLKLAAERGTDRPALKGEPHSYTELQLLNAGYGLRPDAEKNAAAYARWLDAARRPGRLLEVRRPSMHAHTVTSMTAPWWVGSVLTGAPNYTATEAVFNVPIAIPGGDETTSTAISIWNGLGGFGTGSGLIQGGIEVQTTPTVAAYASWREYCCGAPTSNGYGGAFVPNPGDSIYSEEWYCDATGHSDINGGFGCTYLQDLTTGAILSCVNANGSPCPSVKALPLCSANPKAPNCMTLGLAAEFVIENASPQVSPTSTAFTDFMPAVVISGSGYSATSNSPQDISTDSAVFLLQDFTRTTTQIAVSLAPRDQTRFSIFARTEPTFVGPGPITPPTPPPNNCIFGGAPCGSKCCPGDLQCCGVFNGQADCKTSCLH